MFDLGLGRMGLEGGGSGSGGGGGTLSAIVRDSDGNQFTVSNLVYNSTHNPFIVAADVKDSDGNDFTIFT